MSTEEKTEYVQKVRKMSRETLGKIYRSENLSDKEKRALRQNMGEVRREQMLTEARAFFKMSPAEQDAFLDKRLDEKDAWGKKWAKRPKKTDKPGEKSKTGQPRKGEGRRKKNADEIQKLWQQKLSDYDPEERAIFSEYWRRFKERMIQRRAQKN